jgi:hypothetical protein
MILAGENPSTRIEALTSATLFTTNLTRNDPESNLNLRGDRPATDSLRHGTAINSNVHMNYT